MNTCSVFDFMPESDMSAARCAVFPFFRGSKPLPGSPHVPVCRLSLACAGSMRFRWNETNPVRDVFFRDLEIDAAVPLELIHSRTVYAVDSVPERGAVSAEASYDKDFCSECRLVSTGDGLITLNRSLVPVITVADCMPVYLYDPVTGCFGLLHSGWRGTGIASHALKLASRLYGARAEDFLAVLGPHIHDCCYTVGAERAEYFIKEYTPECVRPAENALPEAAYHLSLAKANEALLVREGVLRQNILHCTDCTCCDSRFGSFRRQAAGLDAAMPLEERIRFFTAMAAFIMYP